MPDRPDPERDKLWGRALASALKYALHKTRDAGRAKVLAADAVAAALDPERSPWDETKGRTLSQHVVNLVREGLKAEREKKRVREDPVNQAAVDEEMRRAADRPDAPILAQQAHARGQDRWHRVRGGLDGFAQTVLDLFGEGLAPREQAARLGVDVSRIYEARRRIAERIRALPVERTDAGGVADADWQDPGDESDGNEPESGEGEVGT
jgi:hypothetical protein